MYVNPFVAGVLSTVFVELLAIMAISVINFGRKK